MRTVLAVIFLAAVVGVGLGFYLGWFSLAARQGEGGADVTLSVDRNKMAADRDKAVEKMQDLSHQAASKVAATTQKVGR